METLYFTLGIASVVVAVVAAVAVWAGFKVGKVSAELKDLERSLHEGLSAQYRDTTMVEHTIQNNINHNMRDLDGRVEEVFRTCDELNDIIESRVDELYRHIDSRVDKLDAKYSPKGVKQQING
jgi:uncharacterized protein YoxC